MAAAAVAALAGLTACSTKPISKAGSTDQHAQAIVLQMPDGSDPDGLYLAQDIAKLSHGALKVTIDSKTYNSTLPANEARLTSDIRAGRVSFAYQPARDWAAVGVPGFQALMAPFAVTTVAASQRVAASPVAATVLGQLSKYGAVGVGLIAGEPRQILSVRPLFTQAQFAGQKIRIVDNPQAAALVTALGARPVQGTGIQQGELPAADAGLVTAVEILPVLHSGECVPDRSALPDVLRGLPEVRDAGGQQEGVGRAEPVGAGGDQAGRRRYPGTFWSAGDREAQELTQLCHQGVVLDRPSAAQLGALARSRGRHDERGRGRGGTVRSGRCREPACSRTRPGCRRLPGRGRCGDRDGDSPGPDAGPRPPGGGKIPPGTYVVTDTVADFQAGGQYGDDWEKDITFTCICTPMARSTESQVPDYPDQGPSSGHYVVKGDEVTFSYSHLPSSGCTAPQTVRWSYFDGQLTFAIVDVADTGSRVIYTAHPWRKTG